MDPDGQLVELDVLWPLIHYERDADGTTDLRLRPLWRRTENATASKVEHQFLVPLGEARFDPTEDVLRFLPLFYYREHLHEGRAGEWDRDWFFTPFIWGGSSAGGEDYLAVFPIYGSIPNIFTYDRFTWILFPLLWWSQYGDATGVHMFGSLISWSSREDPNRVHWWRVLPFYGETIVPGKSESYMALWPFFHWGRDRLDKQHSYDSFFFFPLIGWKTGGAFFSWTFLWPFFRHAHKTAGVADEPGKDYSHWDILWPIFRYIEDTWSDNEFHQWWITPLVSSTRTKKQESLVLLYPLIWLRRFWDKLQDRSDTYVLPFFWRNRIRYKKAGHRGTLERFDDAEKFEASEDDHWRLWPLADYREDRHGSWRWRALDPWPYDGYFTRGVRPAYDFIWTLAESSGDSKGNRRVRSLANVYTSRTFAGRKFQCSVPWLFNYEQEENGGSTLRLLQVLPVRWGGDR